MIPVIDPDQSGNMLENKADKQQKASPKTPSRHDTRAEERRQRQADALRANLKKRKTQIHQRGTPNLEVDE